VSDGQLTSATAPVTLTVLPVNDAPVAAPLSLDTAEDVPAGGTLAASDLDGDALTFAIFDAPSHGTVTLGQGGSFTYTPAPDYFGSDRFTFRASDGSAYSAAAAVDVTVAAVNDTPTATDVAVATDDGVAVDFVVPATDADGDALDFSVDTLPAHGSVLDLGGGAFRYLPDPGFFGADAFTVAVSDGELSAPATISVQVRYVNRAPVALDDSAVTFRGAVVTGNVLSNDSDVENDALSAELSASPPTARSSTRRPRGSPGRTRSSTSHGIPRAA
jgi:hypothetical protein